MKYLSISLIISALVFAGCGKKEAPVETVADVASDPAPVEAVATVEETAPEAADALASVQEEVVTAVEEVVESVTESLPDAEAITASMPDAEAITTAMPEAEEITATMPDAEAITASMPQAEDMSVEIAQPEIEVAVAEAPAEADSGGLMGQAMGAAAAMAGSVDWANLSWDKVSQIPYDDKAALLAWATPQIDALKDKLTKAALDKGTMGLANLGDSGWQGAIKGVVQAVDGVRESNPETWEMARGALVSAWDILQTEADKFLGAG